MGTPTPASTPEEPATDATRKRQAELVEELNVYMYMLRSRHDTSMSDTSTTNAQHEELIDLDAQFWSKVVADIKPAVQKIREQVYKLGASWQSRRRFYQRNNAVRPYHQKTYLI